MLPMAPAAETPVSPQKLAILQAAQLLFIQRGYDGVSIRDLAAGMRPGQGHHLPPLPRQGRPLLQRARTRPADDACRGDAGSRRFATCRWPGCMPRSKPIFVMLRDRRTGVMWSVHENTQLKAHLQHFFRRNIRLILDPWIQILNQGKEEGVFRDARPAAQRLDPAFDAQLDGALPDALPRGRPGRRSRRACL